MSVEARILAELSEEGYSSGQAISEKLKITRSAVWKHIVKLRERGYVIEALPRHGYRLASRPDMLLPGEITPLLRTRVIGSRIVHLEETGSTADDARRLIDDGAGEGTVVLAENQTAGRGRLGREWRTSPGQAIALSVVLYPALPPTQVPLLSLATGLAARNAVAEVAGEAPTPALKWPNDIYLNGRKLGGVLVEMAAELDHVRWVIASIGLNVNNSFEGTDLSRTATSLATELGRKVSRRDLAVALLGELDSVYDRARTPSGLAEIRHEFEQLDLLRGHGVEVVTPGGTVSGVATGIDDEGRLLVRRPDGEVEALFSGEASLAGSGRVA
ncbi:MAG: biotin--[acetyl-CoA-carboxylase] ligase [Thermoleophilia bacterium]